MRECECGPFFAAVAPYLPTFRPPLPRPRAFAEAPPLFAGGVCRGGVRRSGRCGGVRRGRASVSVAVDCKQRVVGFESYARPFFGI